MTFRRLTSLAVLATLLSASFVRAQDQEEEFPEPDRSVFNLDEGLALGGFDPVGYFEEGQFRVKKGKKKLAVDYEGVTYHFRDKKTKAVFEDGPSRFEPAYGGYCALAMAEGEKVGVEPEAFAVVGGTLFLFSGLEQRDQWLGSIDEQIAAANLEWRRISGVDDSLRAVPIDESAVDFQTNDDGLIAGGYDVVSYFPEAGGKPKKGSSKLTVTFRGADYAFSGRKTMQMFLQRPDRYVPAYHGYCAYAIAKGSLAQIDPRSFLIEDGRLLLFYAGTDNTWQRDESLAEKAESSWRRRLQQN
ncbi:MAG: YHS domain-containing (seleno)protein [Planctomycetota bacterium]